MEVLYDASLFKKSNFLKVCQTSVQMRPQYYTYMAKDTIYWSTSGKYYQ